jgi:hypothetical protein
MMTQKKESKPDRRHVIEELKAQADEVGFRWGKD